MDRERIADLCYGLVGTVMTSFEKEFVAEYGRKPTDAEVQYSEEYMRDANIQECDNCGWWTDEGHLCDDCAEEIDLDDEA